jgi:hypothetical protein
METVAAVTAAEPINFLRLMFFMGVIDSHLYLKNKFDSI